MNKLINVAYGILFTFFDIYTQYASGIYENVCNKKAMISIIEAIFILY
jgi:hypothetical protein